MSIKWDKIINLDDLHQCSREWERNFVNILDKHAPFKHRKVRNNYALYIDHELRQKMFLRDLYKKKHSKYGDANDWITYKNLKNECNVMINSKRKSYFSQKLHEAKGDSKETWRVLNSALGRRSKTTNINSLKADNDNEVTCHKDIANILNTHFATVSDKVLQESGCRLTLSEFQELRHGSSISPLDYLSHIGYEGEPFKFRQITVEDIIRSASTLKNSKSGELPSKFLKDAIDVVAPSLAVIFNRSFKEGIFPDNLKVARICPINKGKGSKSDLDKFKANSVLSVVARLFEKLVHDQLLKHLDKYLYSNQSGFRPRHSTETSLLNATNQLFLNIDRGQYNVAVFIDLRKAFDTVNHNILLCKLWHYGIRGTELRWFKSYLSHRHQYCSVSGHASDFTLVTNGIPQGSSLGPLLFLVYVNDLPNAVHYSQTGMYADDTGLYAAGFSISEIETSLNKDLSRLCLWLHANKLSINSVKSKFMLIASPHSVSKLTDHEKPHIKILGKFIEQVSSIDCLGMMVDQFLRWDKHVGALSKKISSAISSLKIAGFLPSKALINIYYSIVESKLRYCNTVWGNCNLSLKRKLQNLQNRAVRIVSKDYSSPVEEVFTNLKLLNVQQLIDLDTAILIYKSQHKLTPQYISDMFVPSGVVHSHNTRHSVNGLFIPHCKSTYGSRCFVQIGSRLWNNIPNDVQTAKSVDTFKSGFRNYLLQRE